MLGQWYSEVPRIRAETSLDEAIEIMISQQIFILQITDVNGKPVGWLSCLDIIRTLKEAPTATDIMRKSIKELMQPTAVEDYLDLTCQLSEISAWTEKKGFQIPYLTTTYDKAGIFSVRGLLQAALKERDRERELRKKAEIKMEHLSHAKREFEKALTNFFVDRKVVEKLKSIVEYRDEYDPDIGKIRITGVIREGVYHHVVNILRLLAELSEQGLMELPNIHQETLVKTAIFHDLGKVQPHLEVGDVVDPKEAFEPGKFHAFRSALIAEEVYHLDKNVIKLIKYHHEEDELLEDFPHDLLPMHRVFRLVDGLSAGITRRGSRVSLKVRIPKIQVTEESEHPDYNRYFEFDLYSGMVRIEPIVRRGE